MGPLKHPRVYRVGRGNRIAVAVMWTGSFASMVGWLAYHQFDLVAMIHLGGPGMRAAWYLFLATSAGIACGYGRESLTIGPDDIVLTRPLGRQRIRHDDVAGCYRRRLGPGQFTDVIVSRSDPNRKIQLPTDIQRDTALTMWLRALPDLGERQ